MPCRHSAGRAAPLQRGTRLPRQGDLAQRLNFLKMPVLLHGVPERLPVRVGTVEDFQFAAPIIVKPLDAPLALAILKNLAYGSPVLTD